MVLDSADDVGSSASMAVVNGNPAVAYLDETNGDLNFIRATNSSGSNWGAPGSLFVDPDTHPADEALGALGGSVERCVDEISGCPNDPLIRS